MIYKHKWVNDGYNFFAVDQNGSGFEWNEKPEAEAFEWTGDKSRYIGKFSAVKWQFSLIQRYTDQQMELEGLNEGWVLVGDEYPSLSESLYADLFDIELGELKLISMRNSVNWKSTAAYRLSNADGYMNGVFVGETKPDKPEWKSGELPITGTVCEVNGNDGWEVVTICGHSLNGKKAFYNNSSGAIGWATANIFRPIPSERDKVIAKANDAIEDKFGTLINDWQHIGEIAEYLYELGMLKAAKESS